MKTKNLVILAAVVIAVGAYVFLFERHQPTSEEAQQEADKVLQDFDSDDVQTIEIESEVGVGTTFVMRFPILQSAAPASTELELRKVV